MVTIDLFEVLDRCHDHRLRWIKQIALPMLCSSIGEEMDVYLNV